VRTKACTDRARFVPVSGLRINSHGIAVASAMPVVISVRVDESQSLTRELGPRRCCGIAPRRAPPSFFQRDWRLLEPDPRQIGDSLPDTSGCARHPAATVQIRFRR
jgi:hypothetical protein